MSFRDEFPICENICYFNSAALGPFSRSVFQGMTDWAQQSLDGASIFWPEWYEKMLRAIPLSAKLVNAQDDEIALTRSTSEGLKIVAEGLPWEPGDNVVFPDNEFPANIYPWTFLANRGVEPRRVPLPDGKLTAAALEPYIDNRTRLVSVSWVSYCTGWRANIKEIAQMVHSHGALLCVDGIQGMGAFPFDVQDTNVDFLSVGAQKWLLSAQGSGFFYCKNAVNGLLRNINFGWASVENHTDFSRSDWQEMKNAQRFMTATTATPAWLTMTDSLETIFKYGQESITNQILKTRRYLIERLEQFSVEFKTDILPENDLLHGSGIIFFGIPGISEEKLALIAKNFVDKGIELTVRNGGFRVSVHGFNNKSDVDQLIDALEQSIS